MITLGVQPKDGGSSPLFRSNLSLPLFGGVFIAHKKRESEDSL
jgi:hypothetical protein